MVCDALDRLASDRSSVRALSRGLVQLALDLRGFRRVNVKVFLRRDQFEDPELFDFPDASKLRTSAVDLDWEHDELYGLLFKWIRTEIPADAWEDNSPASCPRVAMGTCRPIAPPSSESPVSAWATRDEVSPTPGYRGTSQIHQVT